MHSFMKPVILKEQSLDVLYFAGINRKRQHACVCMSHHWKQEGGVDWAGQLTRELEEPQRGVFDSAGKKKA